MLGLGYLQMDNPHTLFSRSYFIWLVVLTPYNIPLQMCITTQFMFFTCMIFDPKTSKNKMDIYLQSLIDELNELWGVESEP